MKILGELSIVARLLVLFLVSEFHGKLKTLEYGGYDKKDFFCTSWANVLKKNCALSGSESKHAVY